MNSCAKKYGLVDIGVEALESAKEDAELALVKPAENLVSAQEKLNQEQSNLSEKGVKIIRKPEEEEWGGLIATIEDPDNNIIQLLQKSS